jgi:ABC-2 type transport system permease protein
MAEFNPVLVKELRGRMRGPNAFMLLTGYLMLLGLVTILLYIALADSAGSDLNAGQRIGKQMFLVITTVALIEVCVITPALTAGSIVGEKERQTYDLLIASLLSPWQILWGKLASALAFALLMIVSVVPLMSLAFLFGGVSLAEVLIALAGLTMTALLYATVGLFWSTIMHSTLGATSFALGSIILILLGIPFLVAIFTLIFGQGTSPDWTRSAVFIYISGAFVSTHPFIALGLTETLLSNGDSPFYSIFDPQGANIPIPSPWLAYVLLAALFSAVLIWLSVRMLRPEPQGRQNLSPS